MQGHGEIVLRGEIGETINSSINYLNKMQSAAGNALTLNQSRDDMLREYDIESCGKSRIALNGLVQQLHAANMITTYDRITADRTRLTALKARSVSRVPTKPRPKRLTALKTRSASRAPAKPAPKPKAKKKLARTKRR